MQAEGLEVSVAKTTPVEHLNFQVDSFCKANVDATNKVIADLLPIVAQGIHKLLQWFEMGIFI